MQLVNIYLTVSGERKKTFLSCQFISSLLIAYFVTLFQLASLGGFILVFGFFAFNGSSQGSISAPGDGAAVSIAVKNTVMSACGGAFTTLLMNKTKYFGDKKWSYLTTLNGCLTGMVIEN